MAKSSSQFVCQQCGYEASKWFGKCPGCGEWNSAVETVVSQKRESKRAGEYKRNNIKPVSLDSVSSKSTTRISTKISELDRVLGGGLVPGQVVLIAGEPGIGKSTLLLQVADKLSETRDKELVLYTSGEESVNQIKIRADRLGIKNNNIQLLEETDVDVVIEEVSQVLRVPHVAQEGNQKKVRDTFDRSGIFLIIDSIQTTFTSDLSGMAGSVGQVRECAYRLVRFAKLNNIPVLIVGHVTKDGSIAGPSVLMHIVDTVLWFEGDRTLPLRLLRATKNRFGPTDEVGVFEMQDKGLLEVNNPEKIFISKDKIKIPGSVRATILEGTRPILIEIQSLVVPNKMVYPKRIVQGMDVRRLELLLAVLQRRCGLPLNEHDVFVNTAGGISIKNDPSADLAVCFSIASAFFDRSLPSDVVFIGEVGLLGDIREVSQQNKRIKETKRLGFKKVITGNEISYLREGIRKYLK